MSRTHGLELVRGTQHAECKVQPKFTTCQVPSHRNDIDTWITLELAEVTVSPQKIRQKKARAYDW
jgi:hypothetical protein